MKKKVILKRIYHRDKWRIAIYFDFDEKLKGHVKSITGCLYSSTCKCFYTDDNGENLKLILKTLRDIADIDINALTVKDEELHSSSDPHVIRETEISHSITPVSDEEDPDEIFNQEDPIEESCGSDKMKTGRDFGSISEPACICHQDILLDIGQGKG
jgi:hypothetical protein